VEDWQGVTRRDFDEYFGRGLVKGYYPHWDLLAECFPQWDWSVCRRPPLSVDQILAWADDYFARHGKWPRQTAEKIHGANETWQGIAQNLRLGLRGFPRGSSLARLLQDRRGARNDKNLPPLTERQIVAWAKAHFKATGHWPNRHSGVIDGSNGERWRIIDRALRVGLRGLRGGSTVRRFLQKHGLPDKSCR
jgi:hypothetical protein